MIEGKYIADYEKLIHSLPIAVYLCDTDGNILYYNEAAEKLWGQKPEAGKHKCCGAWQVEDPEGNVLQMEEHPIFRALEASPIPNEEYVIVRPDYSRSRVISHPQILRDGQGEPTGVLITLLDITQQVDKLKNIEESERTFRNLANSIPNLAWMANKDGWIFWYNKNWYEYTGTTPEEMEGWGWKSVHDPVQLPLVLEKWEHSIKTGQAFEMIFPIKGADDVFRSFLTRVYPVHDTQGNVLRWFGTNTDINDQKKLTENLEANLKRSQRQIKSILQFAPDAVISIDEEGKILSWNPEAENIFGWKEGEVLGKSLTSTIIPKRHHDGHDNAMGRFLETRKASIINKAIEMPALRKNGKEFPVELKISNTTIDGKEIFIGFLRDITERRRAEETIRNKTNQLVEAQQLAHIGSWEWDVRTDKIEWSDELYRIYGRNPEEFEANYENYMLCLPAEERDYVDSIVKKAFVDQQPFNFTHRVLRPDGTELILSATGKVVVDANGQTIKMTGTAQDVTDQKNYEQKLLESEERFFKIFHNNPVPLSLTDLATNKIRYVNSLFTELFGYSRDEIIGNDILEMGVIEQEEYLRIVGEIFEILEEKRSVEEMSALPDIEAEEFLVKLENSKLMKDFEVTYIKKSGERFQANVSFEVIRLNNERYTVASYMDITEQKKAAELLKLQNEQLEMINQELESFAFISSHDLQEPLRKIQIFAGRILDKEQDNLSEKSQFQFGRIIHAAQKMQNLIQDLLAYSRTNTIKEEFELTNVNELVNEVLEEFQDSLHDRKIILDVGDLGELKLLKFQFRQLLQNLISNSLKFARQGVRLKITMEADMVPADSVHTPKVFEKGTLYHLKFSDNGIGIEKDHHEKVFEVFQRLHGKDEYPGTGIGLAIVKKIIDNHNGSISLESAVGKGTTFNIYIPVS